VGCVVSGQDNARHLVSAQNNAAATKAATTMVPVPAAEDVAAKIARAAQNATDPAAATAVEMGGTN